MLTTGSLGRHGVALSTDAYARIWFETFTYAEPKPAGTRRALGRGTQRAQRGARNGRTIEFGGRGPRRSRTLETRRGDSGGGVHHRCDLVRQRQGSLPGKRGPDGGNSS